MFLVKWVTTHLISDLGTRALSVLCAVCETSAFGREWGKRVKIGQLLLNIPGPKVTYIAITQELVPWPPHLGARGVGKCSP